MKKQLEQFYRAFGDRGVMFILFAFSVVLHALLAMLMELPAVHPDEIGVASISAFYTGRDWSGVMGQIGYYYGYIQALLYVPLFLLFSGSPLALYKSMLVMNGVVVSFIPLIAYHLSSKLGIAKVWQKVVIAVCSGLYITYVAHSEFIWNEAICSLLPWFMIWCIFMAWDRKNAHSRFAMSVLTGFMCAVCYAAHARLIAVVIALVLTLLAARLWLKQKILNLPVFFVTMIISFATEHLCRAMIKELVWGGNASGNTVENEIGRISGLLEEGGVGRFFSTLFGHLYTFFTSTLGLGAVAAVVAVILIAVRISEDCRDKKHRAEVDEDGTKEYEPSEHKYSVRLMVFGMFAFPAVGGTLLMSALFKFNSDKISSIKDIVIFGRYVDSVAPLMVMLVLAFMFMYGIKLRHIFSGMGIYAVVCVVFSLAVFPVLDAAATYRESPILGLIPWRIGEDYSEPVTGMSFLIMSSCVFAMFALMIIFTSCSNGYYMQLISTAVCGACIYTTVFAGVFYLPMRTEENKQYTDAVRELCGFVYNDPQSPQVVTYGIPSRISGLVQFLNPDTSVEIVRSTEAIPESCLLIADTGAKLTFSVSAEIIGTVGGYNIYAVGDGARDYISYKRSANTAFAAEDNTTEDNNGAYRGA